MVMLAAAFGITACSSPGAKLTDRIGKAGEQAQETVQALLAANWVLSGHDVSSRAVPQEGDTGWSFSVRPVHAQELLTPEGTPTGPPPTPTRTPTHAQELY